MVDIVMHNTRFGILITALSLSVACMLPSRSSREPDDAIGRLLESQRDDLIMIRRDIHQHPEIAGEEERTAGIVAEQLRRLGLTVETGVGGHGVVGILEGGLPGPVVAYRADMDAMASDTKDPVKFRSVNPGVRHICGHDIHTTVGIGIARALAAQRETLPGTVKFIFQPTEENAQGARAMIEAGVLEDPAPEAIFAVHSSPNKVGSIGSMAGLVLGGLDVVKMTLSGEGDLAAAVKHYSDEFSKVGTGTLSAPVEEAYGTAPTSEYDNIIVAGVFQMVEDELEGTWTLLALVRTLTESARQRAKEDVMRRLDGIKLDGISCEYEYMDTVIPPMVNDPTLTESAYPSLRQSLGLKGLVIETEPSAYFSEDFAFYQQKIPGAMYFLGVEHKLLGYWGLPHHPKFKPHEESILIGSKAMARVLVDYMQSH